MRERVVMLVCALGAVVAAGTAAQTPSSPLGIGRPATADDIRVLDIDVMPDGRGLPVGRGTAAEGAAVYTAKCASCHGVKGAGGSAERLTGRTPGDSFAFATNANLVRTIGSYWPYATTLYDYTARAMPFQQPGTLTPGETYRLVALPALPQWRDRRRRDHGPVDAAKGANAGSRAVRARQSPWGPGREVGRAGSSARSLPRATRRRNR